MKAALPSGHEGELPMLHERASFRLAMIALFALCACGSSNRGPHDATSTSAATNGSAGGALLASTIAGAPDAAAVTPSIATTLPSSAPSKPSYEVPVSDARLAAYARFELGHVAWNVDASEAWLSYDFPAALSGVANQNVSFRGTVVAPGIAQVAGDAGSAQCAFSSTVVRCNEMMTGLATDPAAAKASFSARSPLEQMLQGQVIDLFSSDPIGVLTFAPSGGNDGSDDR